MNIKIDINVCRVCLQANNTTINLFDGDNLEKFLFTTLVQVEKNDGLPELLCQKCYGRMRVAYEFKKHAEDSDKHLRSFIQDVNNKFKQVTKRDSNNEAEIEDEMRLYDSPDDMNTPDATSAQQLIKGKRRPASQHKKMSAVRISTGNITIPTQANLVEILESNNQENDQYVTNIEELMDDVQVQQLDDESTETEVVIVDENGIELIDNYKIDEQSNDMIEYHHQDEYVTGDTTPILLQEEEDDDEDEVNSESVEEVFFEEEEHLDDDLDYTEPTSSSGSRKKFKNEGRIAVHFCMKCNKDFSTRTNLTRHLLTHDGQKPYVCNVCGNSFTQNGSLKSHMYIHTGHRPYKCHVCPKAFTQSKSLTFHLRRHTGEKPFTCKECGMKFRQKDGLKRHEATKHSNEPPGEYPCHICGKILLSKYSLKLHLNKHTDKNAAHTCDICDQNFASKNTLINHKKQHKLYSCEICNKEFTDEGDANAHEMLHKDSKPHVCGMCGKAFVDQEDHANHMETHSSKNYKCSVCNKSFSIKTNFISHMINHNIEVLNIFKCDECNVGFDSQRALKLHRSSRHKDNSETLNECEICNIQFITGKDLDTHIQQTHDCIDMKCDYCNQHFFSKKLYQSHLMEHELNIIQDDGEVN